MAGAELVVTNAHVVAGTAKQWVQVAGDSLAASVVAFDPDLDVAACWCPASTSSRFRCCGRGRAG